MLVPFHKGNGTGGTEQNKVDVFADRYVCSAAVIGEIGQSQFAPLKLRSLALVPSSGALPRPFELHLWQLHCETLPSAQKRSGQRLAVVPRPGFASPGARGIRWKERPAGAGGSASKRSACGWFIPTRPLRVLPPNKGKAVARLLPAPRSGCLPLPLTSLTRSRQETRSGIPPGPPRGKQSPGRRSASATVSALNPQS